LHAWTIKVEIFFKRKPYRFGMSRNDDKKVNYYDRGKTTHTHGN